MTIYKKHILRISIFVGLVVLAISLYILYSGNAMVILSVRRAHAAQVRLLCKTDHQSLLEAGRRMLQQVAEGELEYGSYRVPRDPRLPKGWRFPKPILDLSPRSISVKDGYLQIDMHGSMWHFGVYVYPDGFKPPCPDFAYGDRKLLDGLWYYDDEYVHDAEYDSVIDAMVTDR